MTFSLGSIPSSWNPAGGLSQLSQGAVIGSVPALSVNNVATLPAQAFVAFLCTAAKNAPVSVMGTYVNTAGVTAGAGVNQMGIYSPAGVLLASTGDLTAAFGTTGVAEGALNVPVPLVAGNEYFLAMLANFTGTALQTVGYAGQAFSHGNPLGGIVPNLFQGAVTALPASFSPGGLAAGGTVNYVYAR